ncbi:FAD-binding oxidoreductase [Phycicoccus flavus]|uniref:FAD-binding oxidoreductase n=1 Tax=Phycicoccus flavus TaxID=2502783 RepID=UPI000FEBB28C|nr:FAD-binding oxidoreductase [Phycicoccus flavus]NHA69043.1 FAD-binding oxidoreductase [Phycicoccus flavus]
MVQPDWVRVDPEQSLFVALLPGGHRDRLPEPEPSAAERLAGALACRRLSGPVLLEGDPGYDESRRVWNALVDHRPAAVVLCETEADVVAAVAAGREAGVDVGVRCGGHSIVGHSVPDGGLMVDLRRLSRVEVDPEARTATVQGGALLGALDRATEPYGLATTTGNVSHTGIGGLALGGGMGWLARQHGLTCDNLLGCRVVTADGRVVTASAKENPDLFWALRGGGGNFGVVTELTLRLHPVPQRVLSIEVEFPAEQAHGALARWRDLSRSAPREATFLLDVFGGVALLGVVWIGDLASGRAYAEEFLRFEGEPSEQVVEELTYLELQVREDTPQGSDARRYWKAFYLDDLPDDAVAALLGQDPGFAGSIVCHGGAIEDVPADATAFSHRSAAFEYVGAVRWEDPAEDVERVRWGRRQATGLAAHASGTYVNTVGGTGSHPVRSSYSGTTLERLRRVKRDWDPENLFHLNHNIEPA